jgi:hypothetical protein
MHGFGFIRDENRHNEFAFSAAENAAGAERGKLLLTVKSGYRSSNGYRRRIDRFVSTSVGSLTFGPECTVLLAGTGRWNGSEGYHFEVAASDRHNRRRGYDAVRITVTSPSGEVVAHIDGRLDGGNIQHFHRTN